jgi:orotidine-5'-phosphate decarboxylase
MGNDSVKPFLKYPEKWVILLALTSNSGAFDFQTEKLENGQAIFETVIRKSLKWGTYENMMYVVGATKAEMIAGIRLIIPDHFLLVPGIGVQGGNLEEVSKYGMTKDCGLLVNSSRGIIYASHQPDFAIKAREEAILLKNRMESELARNGVI